ncbi:MAG: hypothetical protein JWQ81_8525 [Amycolatopsis sp.]|jgi:hypothetical protein|uniref:hypothetical protein n=1 Tax=Amycolatopsis sp. TaxID=37632 RepID=UPI00261E547D|nr:hypothetical protein [Amycolatopsis sp.]MCU1687786.1 hypothetical protein [Amycolatopsis sp.]
MAVPLAGQTNTAAMLGALANNTIKLTQAPATSSPTVAAVADVPGCSITITTINPNVQVAIVGFFDVTQTAAGDIFVGTCMIDGVSQTPQCDINVAGRATCGQMWIATLATPGSHTMKLRMAVTGGVDTNITAGNTTITVAQFAL